MRARYYNPRIMRFLNADPIGFGGGSNWYAAFNGNPLSFMDPSGYCGQGAGSSGYTRPTGLTGFLLDEGLVTDNRGAIADALGRYQGARDTGNTLATIKYGAQYLATASNGSFAPSGPLALMMSAGIPAEGAVTNQVVQSTRGGGVFTGSMAVAGNVATYEVGVVVGDSGTILSGLRTVTQQAGAAGADTLVINTGHVVNEELAASLMARAQSGTTLFGGTIEVSYQGAASPIFKITVPLKP